MTFFPTRNLHEPRKFGYRTEEPSSKALTSKFSLCGCQLVVLLFFIYELVIDELDVDELVISKLSIDELSILC